MRDEPVVAVVGASTLVGAEVINLLTDRNFSYSELKLLESKTDASFVTSAGKISGSRVLDLSSGRIVDADQVEGGDVSAEELSEESFDGVDLVFFADSAESSKEYLRSALDAKAVCIDCTSYSCLHADVPLVAAGVNLDSLNKSAKHIAIPNAVVSALAAVVEPIRAKAGLKRIVLSTYQSASGAGQEAMDELWAQSLAIFNQTEIEISSLPHQLAFNCIPQTESIQEDGVSREEQKIGLECRKILGLPELGVSVTTVRLPIFHGLALSLNLELNSALSPEEVAQLYSQDSIVQVFAAHDEYPMPISAVGESRIQLGRIRRDNSVAHGLNLWVVVDNIRVCGALNAVMVAEHLIA